MASAAIITTDNAVNNNSKEISIGLSSCLAGELVRYNGGHTQSRLCLDVLSEHFSFETFCPEVAAGFSIPRPTMRLVGDPSSPRLVFSNDASVDLTDQLVNGFKDKLPTMKDLSGYILMKNSPSCGLSRVKVYQDNGHPNVERSVGLFANALHETFPLMPLEEEGRLNDPRLFENFILRVFAYHNFKQEVFAQPSLKHLIDFHSSYKYVLMAHSQNRARELGRMLAKGSSIELTTLCQDYLELFMSIIAKPAKVSNHTNALMHILGYLKKTVPAEGRQNIRDVIMAYRKGLLPLITPVMLLRHHIDQGGSEYIRAQRYLQPYPESLCLMNRV